MQKLIQSCRAGWKAPDRRPATDWAKENVYLPEGAYSISGYFDVARSPWLREVFEACQDPTVREVVFVKGVKVGGTLVGDVRLPWIICCEPGNYAWYGPKDDFAKHHCESKINKLLDACEAVRPLMPTGLERHKKRTAAIHFRNMSLTFEGANEGNLQSKDCRYVSGHECWQWTVKGAIAQAKARTKAFWWNSHCFFESQGAVATHDFAVEWMDGDQRIQHWRCPECGDLQPLVWGMWKKKPCRRDDNSRWSFVWDDNEETRPGGQWNIPKAAATVRLCCRGCRFTLFDDPLHKMKLRSVLSYVPTATSSKLNRYTHTAEIVSLRCPSFVGEESWSSICARWLKAERAFSLGNEEPRKDFVMQECAEFWEEHWSNMQDVVVVRDSDYRFGDVWPDEFVRFLTADKMRDWYRYVVRAWSQDGRSRLMACGECSAWGDVVAVQKKFSVSDDCVIRDDFVGIDCGHDPGDVYRECSRHQGVPTDGGGFAGWKALRGDDADYYTHRAANGTTIKRYFDEGNTVDGFEGTAERGRMTCSVHRYASDVYSGILARLRDGKGRYWGVAADAPNWYHQEMRAEIYDAEKHKWRRIGTRDNHSWDCEKMQLVLADAADLLPDMNPEKQETKQ